MIRQATTQDASRIAEIHVSSWRATYLGMVSDDYLAALDVKEREEVWKELCSGESAPVYVACEAEQIAGFCHISASRDPGAEGAAEITCIYVDPRSLRKGHGRQLISAALSFASIQDFGEVTLWVLSENHAARQFYQAMGFHPDGATKNWGRLIEVRYRIGVNSDFHSRREWPSDLRVS